MEARTTMALLPCFGLTKTFHPWSTRYPLDDETSLTSPGRIKTGIKKAAAGSKRKTGTRVEVDKRGANNATQSRQRSGARYLLNPSPPLASQHHACYPLMFAD